jgi:hypothetical protein
MHLPLLSLAHTALSIVSGQAADRSTVSYGLQEDHMLVMMSAFAALGTIAFRCGRWCCVACQCLAAASTASITD